MTRQQKRKMERNSKKNSNIKQSDNPTIFSISIVDTKTIIERKRPVVLLQEKNLNNHLKKNRKLMETKVFVNFGSKTQSNFGIINITHEYLNDIDFEKMFTSAVDSLSSLCSELNCESILQGLPPIDIIYFVTKESIIDSSKTIIENIKNKTLQTVIELMKYNNEILKAA